MVPGALAFTSTDPNYPTSCAQYPTTPWECSDGTDADSNYNYVMGSEFGNDGSAEYCADSSCSTFDPTAFWTWAAMTADDQTYNANRNVYVSGAVPRLPQATGFSAVGNIFCHASAGAQLRAPHGGTNPTLFSTIVGHAYTTCPKFDSEGSPIADVTIGQTVCLQRNDIPGGVFPTGLWKMRGGCHTSINRIGSYHDATSIVKYCNGGALKYWWRAQVRIYIEASGAKSYYPQRATFSTTGRSFPCT
jgi:hypothetical protein